MRWCRCIAVAFCLLLAMAVAPAAAEEQLPASPPDVPNSFNPAGGDTDSYPTLPLDGRWMALMAIVIAALFLAAAVIGPVIRAEAVEAVPPSFSHHEDPTHHTGREPD